VETGGVAAEEAFRARVTRSRHAEVKVVVDKKGKPIRFERVENDESHQLIEEFMLAANEAVARELKNRGVPAIYRVHENPDPERLGEFREFVLAHGIRVGDLTHRAELQKLLASIAERPKSIRSRSGCSKPERARYATAPLGHYGLANRTIPTSPARSRRYADLESASRTGRARSARELREPCLSCRLLPITFPRPNATLPSGNRCGQNEETGILRAQ